MAAQGEGAGAGLFEVAGGEQEIAGGGGGVRAAAVLRDAHRPQDADAVFGGVDLVGDLLELIEGEAGDLLGVLQGVGLEGALKLGPLVDPLADEAGVVAAGVDEVFGNGHEPDLVGGRVGAEE